MGDNPILPRKDWQRGFAPLHSPVVKQYLLRGQLHWAARCEKENEKVERSDVSDKLMHCGAGQSALSSGKVKFS